MLAGQFTHQVDYKGRVSVPKKFRLVLVGGGVVTRGLDGCLFLYSKKGWEVLTGKLRGLPLTGKDARAFSRYLLSNATEAHYDRLGRISVPSYLLEFAKIERDVVFVGVGDRVEIWSAQNWQLNQKLTEHDAAEVAEKLTGSGI